MKLHWIKMAWAALCLGAIACGGASAPTARLTTAEAALRAAVEIGASEVPRAALHMKLAQEQIEEARRLMDDDRNAQADLALMRAQADAELAITVAKEHKTIAEAKSTASKFSKLKAQTQ